MASPASPNCSGSSMFSIPRSVDTTFTHATSPRQPMSDPTRMSAGAPSHGKAKSGTDLLSIVIPIFNEEEIVLELLTRLRSTEQTLHEMSVDCEFVLVNDGSSD